jgi:hypothetical protein
VFVTDKERKENILKKAAAKKNSASGIRQQACRQAGWTQTGRRGYSETGHRQAGRQAGRQGGREAGRRPGEACRKRRKILCTHIHHIYNMPWNLHIFTYTYMCT